MVPLSDNNPATVGPTRLSRTHNFFYDTYEENDLRKDVAVATFNISNEDEVRPIAVNQSYKLGTGKVAQELANRTGQRQHKQPT